MSSKHTCWDYVTEDIEANPVGPPRPSPAGPRPCEIFGARTADDGTLFGEDEFHSPAYRTPEGVEDLDAPVGMTLAAQGRTWTVIEDPAHRAGRRWAEV